MANAFDFVEIVVQSLGLGLHVADGLFAKLANFFVLFQALASLAYQVQFDFAPILSDHQRFKLVR